MNYRSCWPSRCRGANRCGASGSFWPARYSALWGWGPPGLPGRIGAQPSAGGVPPRRSGTNAWRPAGRATATPAASVEAAEPTSVVPRGRPVATGHAPTVNSDPNNCGACGNVCAASSTDTVSRGHAVRLPSRVLRIAAVCVDTDWDNRNCGGCGNVCPDESACSCGVCEAYCTGCG